MLGLRAYRSYQRRSQQKDGSMIYKLFSRYQIFLMNLFNPNNIISVYKASIKYLHRIILQSFFNYWASLISLTFLIIFHVFLSYFYTVFIQINLSHSTSVQVSLCQHDVFEKMHTACRRKETHPAVQQWGDCGRSH